MAGRSASIAGRLVRLDIILREIYSLPAGKAVGPTRKFSVRVRTLESRFKIGSLQF
jgi:hypothetical protein